MFLTHSHLVDPSMKFSSHMSHGRNISRGICFFSGIRGAAQAASEACTPLRDEGVEEVADEPTEARIWMFAHVHASKRATQTCFHLPKNMFFVPLLVSRGIDFTTGIC